MTRITESAIEAFAIELLEKQGYHYIYGPSIAPDSASPERASFEEVLLLGRLQTAVARSSSRPLQRLQPAKRQNTAARPDWAPSPCRV